MKMPYSIFLIFLFVAFGYGQTVLTGKVLKFDKNELKIEFTLENKNDETIYVATNPQQLNGEFGYYFLLNESDNSILQVSSRVFSPYPGFPYSDDTRVELKKLKTAEKYSGIVLTKFPKRETVPPYFGRPLKEKKIFPEKINQIELTIGYFVEEEGILEFLQRKPFGLWIKGNEPFATGKNKDKTFLEIQNLATIYIPVE